MTCLRLIASVILLAVSCVAAVAADSLPVDVTSTPIETFNEIEIGLVVDEVIWKGGIVLESADDTFGSLSGLTFVDATRFVAVSDEGSFVFGNLVLDARGAPAGMEEVEMVPLLDFDGERIRTPRDDSEAVDIVFENGVPVVLRVGFERVTRVVEYPLIAGSPGLPARELEIPEWMAAIDTNESIEAVCIAPEGTPLAGTTIVVTENFEDENDARAGAMLGDGSADVGFVRRSGLRPTDCAFLPDGDLLLLERGEDGPRFWMQVKRIPQESIVPEAILDGPVIVTADGGIDNMEGLGVRVLRSGEIRISLLSDDDHMSDRQTMLLEFALPE